MDSVEEMNGASILVETCASIEPDEAVLIVSDWRMWRVAERVAAAAKERDANVTMTLMDPREHDGNEPTEAVAAAMTNTDVIFGAAHRNLGHAKATKTAVESGARFVSMTRLTQEQLKHGGLYADFHAMRPHCDAMAERFGKATEARVTTRDGTQATFGLADRPGNSHPCIVDTPGAVTGAFNIEANIAPVEGTTRGTLVFDASVPHFDIGVLEDDIIMEVEDGSVVDIRGGREAEKIERIWTEQGDPAVYNIAQLAVGMNPNCTEFDGTVMNDHGAYGSVHVGIGTSTNLGGETRAPIHFDAMMRDPTLELDGDVVLDGGEFTIF